MKRQFKQYPVSENFADKLVLWTGRQSIGICLRGSGWGHHFNESYKALAAVGKKQTLTGELHHASRFISDADDYVFVHLSYDIKEGMYDVKSKHSDKIQFPEWNLFIPEWVVILRQGHVEIGWVPSDHNETDAEAVYQLIVEQDDQTPVGNIKSAKRKIAWTQLEYLAKIQQTKNHIQAGDIYQANICQEFYWEGIDLHPASLFNKGYASNPNPFSAYYKTNEKHCMCWSPERFLTAHGDRMLSQPMKGTAPRGKDSREDIEKIIELEKSEKDRRENVMIVDMVRNDLSHFAAKGSVQVAELYKIETYPQVHQMHSTVIATLKEGTHFFDALLKAFPMGSMTGAPKKRAMEIIEEIESSKRGLFSGTIGYFSPEGNADFNVVIRTLLYDKPAQVLSCHVGGGITALSNNNAEYEESLIKFEPIRQLIESVTTINA